jgi:hypothetical protein
MNSVNAVEQSILLMDDILEVRMNTFGDNCSRDLLSLSFVRSVNRLVASSNLFGYIQIYK